VAINVVQLGRVPYALGLKLQEELVGARKEGRVPDTLLLLEHRPVITLGRNAKQKHVLASAEQLAARGVEIFECNRGGDVTFHGPGQLVGYPIFNILEMKPRLGAVDFVRRLEEVLIRTCADFGIAAERIPGLTGVWTAANSPRNGENDQQKGKIAAIGIHVSRGVTSHGFALNVETNLEFFRLIVPCGITACPVTSISEELGRPVSLQDVAESAARNSGSVFASQIMWVDTVDALLGRSVGVPLSMPPELHSLARDQSAGSQIHSS
jgi:lipoyl(octanoyl) transferase